LRIGQCARIDFPDPLAKDFTMSPRETHEPLDHELPLDEREDQGRFQGGTGGPASNTGVFADTEPYGGPEDQLGYGSTPAPEDEKDADKPVTSVGAGPGGSMSGTSDAG
jgi:hypothetical protein